MNRLRLILLAIAFGTASLESTHAGIIFTVTEVNGVTTIEGSGSFLLENARFNGIGNAYSGVVSGSGVRFDGVSGIVLGRGATSIYSFGFGPPKGLDGLVKLPLPPTGQAGQATTVSSGDPLSVNWQNDVFTVPRNYVSGTSLQASATFNNSAIRLGFTPGTVTRWSSLAGDVELRVSVLSTVVPEPSTGTVICLGFLATCWPHRQRTSPRP